MKFVFLLSLIFLILIGTIQNNIQNRLNRISKVKKLVKLNKIKSSNFYDQTTAIQNVALNLFEELNRMSPEALKAQLDTTEGKPFIRSSPGNKVPKLGLHAMREGTGLEGFATVDLVVNQNEPPGPARLLFSIEMDKSLDFIGIVDTHGDDNVKRWDRIEPNESDKFIKVKNHLGAYYGVRKYTTKRQIKTFKKIQLNRFHNLNNLGDELKDLIDNELSKIDSLANGKIENKIENSISKTNDKKELFKPLDEKTFDGIVSYTIQNDDKIKSEGGGDPKLLFKIVKKNNNKFHSIEFLGVVDLYQNDDIQSWDSIKTNYDRDDKKNEEKEKKEMEKKNKFLKVASKGGRYFGIRKFNPIRKLGNINNIHFDKNNNLHELDDDVRDVLLNELKKISNIVDKVNGKTAKKNWNDKSDNDPSSSSNVKIKGQYHFLDMVDENGLSGLAFYDLKDNVNLKSSDGGSPRLLFSMVDKPGIAKNSIEFLGVVDSLSFENKKSWNEISNKEAFIKVTNSNGLDIGIKKFEQD